MPHCIQASISLAPSLLTSLYKSGLILFFFTIFPLKNRYTGVSSVSSLSWFHAIFIAFVEVALSTVIVSIAKLEVHHFGPHPNAFLFA